MGEQKHTPEPWEAVVSKESEYTIISPDGMSICRTGTLEVPSHIEISTRCYNANRIIACVNACKDLNPEAISGLIGKVINIKMSLRKIYKEISCTDYPCIALESFCDILDDAISAVTTGGQQ